MEAQKPGVCDNTSLQPANSVKTRFLNSTRGLKKPILIKTCEPDFFHKASSKLMPKTPSYLNHKINLNCLRFYLRLALGFPLRAIGQERTIPIIANKD